MDLVRVLMVGNLTRDAQLLPTPHGPVVRLRVAASSTQLVNGMIEPRTVTMTLEVRGLTEREARALAAAHPRGARVVAEGRLENRKTQRRVTATLADGTSVETQAEVVETIVAATNGVVGLPPALSGWDWSRL
jgi:single-stranded DNA-binding protein